MKVLVVDDNLEIITLLSDILEKAGFTVVKANNGNEAVKLYKTQKPDFIFLDIEMPDIKGYDICKKIRKNDNITPIIFLSSLNEAQDKIKGLELGADDYIIKPFDMGELLARIQAVARRCISIRSPDNIDESFSLQDLDVYPNQLRAKRGSRVIDLSLKELKILQTLEHNTNCVVSREDLVEYCWGGIIAPESRTIDLHISKLRKKIELEPDNPTIIKTVHGVGYRYQGT